MEFAVNVSGQRVHAEDADKEQEYFCPICGESVIPRQGEVNVWHFAHQSACIDGWEYDMSEWHRTWQERFPKENREVTVEHHGVSHRADVLVNGCVIEFQHSSISANEFEERNRFYTSAGYKIIWVFDEIFAFEDRRIIESFDDCNKFIWKWPNQAISSVVPQNSKNIAILLQFSEGEDDNEDGYWLAKVEWAIPKGSKFANYRRFFIDSNFDPDLFSEYGLQDIFLTKHERFRHLLDDCKPYRCKCSRIKGNPRDWYICPKTNDWHNDHCKQCCHNLISEYRKSTDYRRGGLFFYCCYPRIMNGINNDPEDEDSYLVPSIRT